MISVSWKIASVMAGSVMWCHYLAPAEAGEPAQRDCKHQDQQDADQEGGQRHAEQGDGHEQLAGEGTALEGGIHTHGNANHQGQHGGHQGQLQRGREALGNEARNLGPLAQAQAKFALGCIHQKVPKLHEERFVEPQRCAQFADLLGGSVLAQQEHHGVPDILEQHEGDEGHRDHDNHSLYQAAQYEGEHRKVD
jgi:hypothetical protein